MSKPTLSEVSEPYIEALGQVHDKTKDALGRKITSTLARDLRGMAAIIDKILLDHKVEVKAKMGRHARASERQGQFLDDHYCYMLVELLRNPEDHRTWVEVFEKAGEELNAAPETVRKAYYRAKKLLRSQ